MPHIVNLSCIQNLCENMNALLNIHLGIGHCGIASLSLLSCLAHPLDHEEPHSMYTIHCLGRYVDINGPGREIGYFLEPYRD